MVNQNGKRSSDRADIHERVEPMICWRRQGGLPVALLLLSFIIQGAASRARAADVYGPPAADPQRGGTLNVGSMIEPPTLDPFHNAADARIRVTGLMYQGLFYEPAEGDAVPLLAESYELSADRLVYTFRLRRGVKFHTGQTMAAKDVAYSYNYIRDSKNGSPGAGDFSAVRAIEVVDDATVKFTLAQPNASLPMTLGNKYGAVVPDGTFEAPDALTRLNQLSVGTGPFRLAEFKPNSNLTVVRNADYWEPGAPYLDQITFISMPNNASMLVALTNRRVDLALLTRPQDIKQLERVPGLVVERWPSLNQKVIDIGNEYGPLGDVRVRQAIALSLDKDEMMRASIGGYGKVIGTMVAAMQDRWGVPISELPNQKPDLERAKRLLAEAGFADGLELTFTTIIGYDWMEPAAVTLREELARVGIKLNIQRIELGVWIKNYQAKQMGLTFNDWAPPPDPNLLFYRQFHMAPEGGDFRNWRNEPASRILDAARAEADPVKRKALYADFQRQLAEGAPTIMLFSADYVTARSERLRNYAQHPTGWYFNLTHAYLAK
jgi:peptide/nickel transport system substrate-binding protein